MLDDKVNLLETIDPTKRKDLRKAMIGGILATDMTHHFSLTETIKNIAEQVREKKKKKRIRGSNIVCLRFVGVL
jgi:hypothetical protein